MTCGSCKYGKPAPKGGFIICMLRKGWEWFPPKSPCAFSPSRYGVRQP